MTDTSPVPPGLAEDPCLLPQALDLSAGLVRLVRMDATSYRDASFLDDRIFARKFETMLCRWPELVAAAGPPMPADARWIFHIGHVGSTLLSRLLGELTLSIREPRILRDLACAPSVDAVDAEAIVRLLSRRFAGAQPTLVKATSFVSEIAPALCPPRERALFLFASPLNYICSILAGDNSRKEIAAVSQQRARRMASRAVLHDAAASEAHLAAAAWACEMTSLEAAAEAMPGRSLAWADFDKMLCDLPAALAGLAHFFGYAADPGTIAAIASGPLMRRYSKALEYDYSPALRRALLSEAGRAHRRSIEAAMGMLHKAGRESPLLARALARKSDFTEG